MNNTPCHSLEDCGCLELGHVDVLKWDNIAIECMSEMGNGRVYVSIGMLAAVVFPL